MEYNGSLRTCHVADGQKLAFKCTQNQWTQTVFQLYSLDPRFVGLNPAEDDRL
jgi:hypothetical protein